MEAAPTIAETATAPDIALADFVSESLLKKLLKTEKSDTIFEGMQEVLVLSSVDKVPVVAGFESCWVTFGNLSNFERLLLEREKLEKQNYLRYLQQYIKQMLDFE
ncbi:hypothetical protein EB796_010613 [Bugula neritina]|uniref:Uncharacterized protein n=1 Tax=Bugula neritina TaxID=10212 RepID=A0A7J7JYQ3_BUGNE|nr:hypothetical protein EB796_010613 [Bugula neritina]